MAGPSGTVSSEVCQWAGDGDSASTRFCLSNRTELVSTNRRSALRESPGPRLRRAARPPSGATPRPELDQPQGERGPRGSSQACACQSPINSPNIWLISGGVNEIAFQPERIAGHVIAVLRIRQTQGHVALDRYRPARAIMRAISRAIGVAAVVTAWRLTWWWRARPRQPRRAGDDDAMPASVSGSESSIPMVSQSPIKGNRLRVGFAENAQKIRAAA